MLLFQDIILPFFIAAIAIALLSSLINFLLNLIHLNYIFLKVPAFLVVWYFVGPTIYNWLLANLISNTSEWIRFIYNPFHYFGNFISQFM